MTVVLQSGLIPHYSNIIVGSIEFFGSTEVTDRDRVEILRDGTTANIGTEDFTIEVWLKPSATAADNNASGTDWTEGNIFLDGDVLPGGSFDIGGVLNAGNLRFAIQTAEGQTQVTGTTDVRDGLWHFVALTYNHSTGEMALYVDGTREDTADTGTGGDCDFQVSGGGDWDDMFVLGVEKNGFVAFSYTGHMSELRFSNIIRHSGSSGSVPSSPLPSDANTVSHWDMSEGSGTNVADKAGNAPGTMVVAAGVPQWSNDKPYS